MKFLRQKDFIIVAFVFFNIISTKAQLAGDSYYQEIKIDILLPEKAGKDVISLFHEHNKIVAVTSNGVYRFSHGKWSGKPCGTGFVIATLDSNGKVWLASVNSIQNEEGSVKFTLPSTAENDTILCLFWEDKTLHIGTSNGMFSYNGKWRTEAITRGKRINSIALNKSDNLWLASNKGLLKRTSKEWLNLDDFLMAKGTKEVYFSLHIPNNTNDLLFSGLFSVGCIAENGQHWMWSGTDGLPYGPATEIKSFQKTLWFATDKGAIKKDENWHYYHGKRWLPDNKINDILPIDEYTVWIATPGGISQIQKVEMTLEEKAADYEKIIDLRHNRRGLVNLSRLDVPGDISSSKMVNEDNDGLWTSTYLAAECFRYGVTKSPEAKKNAIRTYEALERLETVTGISGLPARSYALATDSVEQSRSPHPKIWRLSPNKKWQWLDDTSSDEIVGHMFAIPIFYDLVADDNMKIRVKNLVQRIMDHIIDNDYCLIDYDGKPTRWGIWHPDSLNYSKNWAYEKGLYSLEILSFLKAAVYITGNQKYEQTYRYLIEKHHYAENTLQAKIYAPFENSHSDDILTYFPYYSLSCYATDDEYWPIYKKSIERTWAVSQPERIPAWNIIASIALQKNCNLEIAREELQLYPLDLIDWRMENSHRWDLPIDEMVDRGGNKQATVPIPTPEGQISKWNTNPRKLDSGSSAAREETGTYFLLPYWMARHHKLFN